MDHRANIDISSCDLPMRVWGAACPVQTPRPGFARWEDFRRWKTGCRGGNRTRVLRGMNPMRYRFSTLRRNGWSTAWVSGGHRCSSLARRGTGGRRLWLSEYVGAKKMTGNTRQTLHIKNPLRRHNEPLVHRLRSDAKRTRQGAGTFCPIFSGLKGHMHFVSVSHA